MKIISWQAVVIAIAMTGSLLMIGAKIGSPAAVASPIINAEKADATPIDIGEEDTTIQVDSPGYNKYTDYVHGYSILFPADMVIDNSLWAVNTVIRDDHTRIEIYEDDFSGKFTSPEDYILYGNKFVARSADHTIQANYWFTVNGYQAHLMQWSRRPLARIPGDRNNYVCAEIVKNSQEVYTVFIKSNEPIEHAREMIASLTFVEKRGYAYNNIRHTPSATPMNAETKVFFNTYFSPASSLRWGVFQPSAPQSLRELTELENKVNYTFPIILHYQMLNENFPAYGLGNAYESNKFVELTLQTVLSGEANALWAETDKNAGMVYDILDGKYDDYLTEYATHLKDFGHPILFRFDNEMNGDWCWYSAYYTSKDAELYKAMWRYVHDLFVRNGVDNIIWVFNPNDQSRPDFKWNNYLAYYPGDDYVDVIGMTGYNTGNYFPGEHWREFEQVYSPLYQEYTQTFDKPFMITEFAANSVGGDKVAWIHHMFADINQFDRIKVAIWWSGVDNDRQGQPGRIYLMDENDEVLSAFKDGLKEYKDKITTKQLPIH